MLLSIDTIRKELDDEFLPLEPDLDGMRLVPGGVEPERLRQTEARFNVYFPKGFADLVSSYDFGNFGIGPVQFFGSGQLTLQRKLPAPESHQHRERSVSKT